MEGEWKTCRRAGTLMIPVDGAWYFSVAAILPRSRLGRRACLSTLHNSRHKNAESEEEVGDQCVQVRLRAVPVRRSGRCNPLVHAPGGGGAQRK